MGHISRILGAVCALGFVMAICPSEAKFEGSWNHGYLKVFERCVTEKNAFECLKKRSLEILDSAIQDETVYKVNDYVSVGRDANVARKLELESSNGTEEGQGRGLDDQLDKKLHDYLATRSLKLTIPGDAFEGEFFYEIDQWERRN